ncbi:MAG: transcriptional regulator [Candidatus Niyogibacteria bacterium]|nr:transcriptional regulator [Candidatus Niyogibacteria bacterium]
MTTLSVPLSAEQEQFVERLVKEKVVPNKAEAVRRALRLLAEEEAVADILSAQREARAGKILIGNPRELLKKF